MVKVLEIRTVGHNRNVRNGGMNGRVEVTKLENGNYKAEIVGQNVTAEAPLQEDAIRAANKEYRAKFTAGLQEPRRMV